MTKHEFLEKLISKKDTWQETMPIFKEQNELIIVTKGICYQGAFQVIIDGDVLFECLVESLKGIIKPMNKYISMKSPFIEYRIDPQGLKENYIYEDRLTCYYTGGKTSFDLRFTVIKEETQIHTTIKNEVKTEAETKIKTKVQIDNKTNIKTNSKRDKSKNKNKDNLQINLSKKTYNLTDIIYINIKNLSDKPRHLVFHCKQDFVSPNYTEVFLKDQWTQEWYLKKTVVERLFGNLTFKNQPFKEVIIEGSIDHEIEASYVVKASITTYDHYLSKSLIVDEYMYNRTKLLAFREYIEGIVNTSSKRDESNLLDQIRACLNFNQEDLELRLFYLWLLIEFGYKKEAKIEMNLISKYEEYYSETKEYPLIRTLKSIINKDNLKISDVFEDIDGSSNWLDLLTKARYTSARNSRYTYYKLLFSKGVRNSFLFAEVTSLLNQLSIIPDKDDELYIITLKWAFNKNGVSSAWLNKLERHYYQLEKNPYMTSFLANELYKRKKSKNFLSLFCQMSIREERYDKIAIQGYQEGLKSDIYIQDLENYYIEATRRINETIDLTLIKHFTKIQYLEKASREYVYLNLVKKKTNYPVLYSRFYNEITQYLKGLDKFSNEMIELMALMYEDYIKDENPIIFELVIRIPIIKLNESDMARLLISQIFDFCMNEKSWLANKQKQQIIQKTIRDIGFEGLSQTYSKEKIIDYYDNLSVNNNLDSYFLDNELYISRNPNTDVLNNLYKNMISDHFIDYLINQYFKLTQVEKKTVKEVFMYYIARRIVVEFETVTDRFLEEMYAYYNELEIKPVWLLLALSRGLNTSDDHLITRIRKLYEHAQKHDIIVPWFSQAMFNENTRVIHYLSHPDDELVINYRFNENTEFLSTNMKHVAFGVFIYRLKLFYGEFFEYYIVIKDRYGKLQLPHSDLIMNKTISHNSLFNENEYSVETRLDNITLSYELNDDLSAKVFIEEQLEFNDKIKRLLKV